MFEGFTSTQLAAVDTPALTPALRAYGLVALEVFGHTSFLGDHQTEILRTAMRNLLEDIHRRIAVAPAPRP